LGWVAIATKSNKNLFPWLQRALKKRKFTQHFATQKGQKKKKVTLKSIFGHPQLDFSDLKAAAFKSEKSSCNFANLIFLI